MVDGKVVAGVDTGLLVGDPSEAVGVLEDGLGSAEPAHHDDDELVGGLDVLLDAKRT